MTTTHAHSRMLQCLRDEMDKITDDLERLTGDLRTDLFERLRLIDTIVERLKRHVDERDIADRYPVTLSDIIG